MNTGGGQTGISTITEFFNAQSTSGDVAGALAMNAVWFKIAMWIIMIVGSIAMAIWIARLAADILLITTRGMFGDKATGAIEKFGTGNSDSYSSVANYLKGNLLEIVLVIVLITFLISGYLFRLIAFAIAGIGTVGNRLLGLDMGGTFSALDANAFIEQVEVQRSVSLRNQYDEKLSALRKYSADLYDMAKSGVVSDDPRYVQMKTYYTQSMVQADIISTELASREGVIAEFNLDSSYFNQHARQSGEGICNEKFFMDTVLDNFNRSGMACS